MKRSVLRAAIVAAVTIAAFVICRKAAVEARGNTLWGGEAIIPLLIPFAYGAIRGIVSDVRGE